MEIHGHAYEVEVRVSERFDAHHSLPTRPVLHLHTWEVEFGVSGPIDPETGMVCDMLELSEFFRPLVQELDGTNLHDFPGFDQDDPMVRLTGKYPTCDTLAHYFVWKIGPEFARHPRFQGLRLSEVRVGVYDPEMVEPWGYAQIRPVDRYSKSAGMALALPRRG